jgi:hypothetical protein
MIKPSANATSCTAKHSPLLTALIGLITLVFAHFLPWVVPK